MDGEAAAARGERASGMGAICFGAKRGHNFSSFSSSVLFPPLFFGIISCIERMNIEQRRESETAKEDHRFARFSFLRLPSN